MALKEKLSGLAKKDYLRYLIAGGFNTALTFAVYSSLIFLGWRYYFANSASWVVGISVSYVLNSRYVFKQRFGGRKFLSFIASNLVSYFVSMAVLYALIDRGGVSPIYSSVIAIPCVVFVNFVFFKFFVFAA